MSEQPNRPADDPDPDILLQVLDEAEECTKGMLGFGTALPLWGSTGGLEWLLRQAEGFLEEGGSEVSDLAGAYFAFIWQGGVNRFDEIRHCVLPLVASVRHYPVRLGDCVEASGVGVAHEFLEELVDERADDFGLIPLSDAVEIALRQDPGGDGKFNPVVGPHLYPSEWWWAHYLFSAGFDPSVRLEDFLSPNRDPTDLAPQFRSPCPARVYADSSHRRSRRCER
jgi:hypothetical protein